MSRLRKYKSAQTAIEYLLLLMTVTAVVLIGFKKLLPLAQEAANLYYERQSFGIAGEAPRCGDGVCEWPWDGGYENEETCCIDCVSGAIEDRCSHPEIP